MTCICSSEGPALLAATPARRKLMTSVVWRVHGGTLGVRGEERKVQALARFYSWVGGRGVLWEVD